MRPRLGRTVASILVSIVVAAIPALFAGSPSPLGSSLPNVFGARGFLDLALGASGYGLVVLEVLTAFTAFNVFRALSHSRRPSPSVSIETNDERPPEVIHPLVRPSMAHGKRPAVRPGPAINVLILTAAIFGLLLVAASLSPAAGAVTNSGNFAPFQFTVTFGDPSILQPHGTCGIVGCDGWLSGQVCLAANFTSGTTLNLWVYETRSVQNVSPPPSVNYVTWQIETSDFGNQTVTAISPNVIGVTAVFGSSTEPLARNGSGWSGPPAGSLTGIQIDWSGLNGERNYHLVLGPPTTSQGTPTGPGGPCAAAVPTDNTPLIAVLVTAAGVPTASYLFQEGEDTGQQDWLVISLLDEDGKPCPGEEFKVTLPSVTLAGGGTISPIFGKLGTDGYARLDLKGIPHGDCQVSFPNLDPSDWGPYTGQVDSTSGGGQQTPTSPPGDVSP